MRTGIATVPLDWGKCPPWLFSRMKQLSRGIMLAIAEEFGPEEILKRLSDPIWFQSLGCVSGFDYNSSGLTTTTMGALKEGLRGLESDLGIFVCGGKGKTSKKTPAQIEEWGRFLNMSMEKIDKLVYASKMSAKIDSALIQDNYNIYTHNLIFSKSGNWSVVQQGMDINIQKARRYHWMSSNVKDFVEEPHSGIICDAKGNPLNLTSQKSRENRNISAAIAKEEPKSFLKNMKKILDKQDSLMKQKRFEIFDPGRNKVSGSSFVEMELNNVEFHWHPIVNEKFDLKRLEKTIFNVNEQNPQNFEHLLSLKGVGPKTVRALSLVSEIIYGAKPSYEDPARYSFSVGGKDGTPFFVRKDIYDGLLDLMEKGIKKSRISYKEKFEARKRLNKLALNEKEKKLFSEN